MRIQQIINTPPAIVQCQPVGKLPSHFHSFRNSARCVPDVQLTPLSLSNHTAIQFSGGTAPYFSQYTLLTCLLRFDGALTDCSTLQSRPFQFSPLRNDPLDRLTTHVPPTISLQIHTLLETSPPLYRFAIQSPSFLEASNQLLL